jgi:glutamyl-tRNA synthetase/glutamyl-Q tRNA(Asp) synthetase
MPAGTGSRVDAMNARNSDSVWKCGRFAPSTTGEVHPGTLVAALLCWLDARSRGVKVVLRLEDLDRARTKPGYVEAMERDLDWFGLDWDARSRQSEQIGRYEAALESLVEAGRVYACHCSRSQIRAHARTAPDGSARYPGTCRARVVSRGDWREAEGALRLRLEARVLRVVDESGLDLSGDASDAFGDPILRRRDGAFAYHFASILDDAAAGVDRVVRGCDLASSTLLQVALRDELGLPVPFYRHHLLLLERSGEKLSKFHGAVGVRALRGRYDAETLCGRLASFVELVPGGTRCAPADLVAEFDWARVRRDDVEVRWGGAPDPELHTPELSRD